MTRPGHLAPLKRVGHKGADHVAPGNSLPSFRAALDLRVDMIEFDVLRMKDGALVLAHDFEDAQRREPPTLDEGLDHFAEEAYAGVELDVDLKVPGYEREVVDGIRARGLTDRVLISSQFRESLRLVRELEPSIRLGWSVPKATRDYTKSWLLPVALVWLEVAKRRVPDHAAAAIRSGEVDALMSHWRLVTPALREAVHDAGGQLYVWTVDDAQRIAALDAMGVDGVITNDPRLFA